MNLHKTNYCLIYIMDLYSVSKNGYNQNKNDLNAYVLQRPHPYGSTNHITSSSPQDSHPINILAYQTDRTK